jgi:hypothetical protein
VVPWANAIGASPPGSQPIPASQIGCSIKQSSRLPQGENMVQDSWGGSAQLSTPAGELLQRLVAALPANRSFSITVFGSAPIQLFIDGSLLSGDVDLFSDFEDLAECVERANLDQKHAEFYIQVSSELNFRTSPRWRERKTSLQIGHCTFHFPHPIDILIAKLHRLEEKDLLAFRVVIAKTGHPTEVELIRELQLAVDLFRPSFDEEQGHDLANNCRRLWPLIFGREIDPRKEIIAPALAERRRGYGEPTRDYKQELREAASGR